MHWNITALVFTGHFQHHMHNRFANYRFLPVLMWSTLFRPDSQQNIGTTNSSTDKYKDNTKFIMQLSFLYSFLISNKVVHFLKEGKCPIIFYYSFETAIFFIIIARFLQALQNLNTVFIYGSRGVELWRHRREV